MNLVIVSGAEATGKTDIAKHIARSFNYEYLGKDEFKEKLFDTASVNTWKYRWFDKHSKDELFSKLKVKIEKNEPVVIESNFMTADKSPLQKMVGKNVSVVEVFCTTRGFTSFMRFVKRNESGRRHKGHHDRRWYVSVFLYNIARMLKINWPYKPFRFNDNVMFVNSTDFSKINYGQIEDFIKKSIKY